MRRILLAFDGSQHAGRAEELAEELARETGAQLDKLHVDWLVVDSAGTGRAEAIAARAEDIDADLVVMGTRGLSRIAGASIGSVSQEVIRLVDRPVLLVP